MYAPVHVATGLAVKKRWPAAPLLGLMLATQAIEFLWIVLSYLGIEYQSVDARGVVHLDSLPYSHSLLTGLGTAVLAYAVIRWVFRRPGMALAVGIAVASHIVYDVVQHEPNIQLAWFIGQPRIGLDLGGAPLLDFAVETALAVACWRYFRGSRKLLAAILVMSLSNLPMMLSDGSGQALAGNHMILPTIILAQTVVTLAAFWGLARRNSEEPARGVVAGPARLAPDLAA